jgi:anti-sigma factor RsiW
MTMHEQWTDQLSDFLDGELPVEQQAAVERHLEGCAECTAVLNDLKRVVARAQSIEPRPPQADLWAGIAGRIDTGRPSAPLLPAGIATFANRARRITVTLPQLAAAALVVAAISGGLAWQLRTAFSGTAKAVPYDRSAAAADGAAAPADGVAGSAADAARPLSGAQAGTVAGRPLGGAEAGPDAGRPFRGAEAFNGSDSAGSNARFETVSLADAQYDAAVVDLERALKQGRGRLDPATIAAVEHNLETIDQAIQQAREALAGDPANTYLSSHLVEARRRKLDLLRRAAALTSESD